MTVPAGTDPVPYQSLYRRFRPQRFDEVLGQEHVTLALRNAVRDGRIGHAYLFSGPRGTGKTSTARILAKALDCANPVEGEPCGVCDSCIEIARGTSMDVHELDAASNNGVDAMRDLVAHSALGTPGRWKVYIVDEVHMLSTAASNALLKTLEEPPAHVVFVLATTDTKKVLPTIRSRTQHFEFRLLGPELLAGLLRGVRDDAALEVADEALESAVRRGRGSARDALSALDQVAAGGSVGDEIEVFAEIAQGLAERDAGRVLVGVAKASDAGLDPQNLSGELADYLRQGFLTMLAPELVSMVGDELARVEDTAKRMGLPAVVRAMEVLGHAMVDMRDSPDPRVHLEAALIRLSHPEADDSTEALVERVERLERAAASTTPSKAAPTAAAPTSAAPSKAAPSAAAASKAAPTAGNDGAATAAAEVASRAQGAAAEAPVAGAAGPDLARRALGALRGREAGSGRNRGSGGDPARPPGAEESPAGSARPTGGVTTTQTATLPTRDELVQAWGDGLLASLPGRARARFRVGRFVSTEGGAAVFALPNDTHRSYCEEVRTEVESVLATRFGTAVPLKLVVDDDTDDLSTKNAIGAGVEEPPESDLLDPAVLEAQTSPAGAGPSPEERIKLAFPGAQEV